MSGRATCAALPSFGTPTVVVTGLESTSDYIDLSIASVQAVYVIVLLIFVHLGRQYGLAGAGALATRSRDEGCCAACSRRIGRCAYPFVVLPAYLFVLMIAAISSLLWVVNHSLDLANQRVPTSDAYSCTWRSVFALAWGVDTALADGLLLWFALERVDRRRAWHIVIASVIWGATNALLALFAGDPDLDTATILYFVRWVELLLLALVVLFIAVLRALRPRLCPGAIRRRGGFRWAASILACVQLAFAVVGFGSSAHFEFVMVGTDTGSAETVNALALIFLIARSVHLLMQMPTITTVLVVDTRHWTRQRNVLSRALQAASERWRGSSRRRATPSRPMLSQRLHGSIIDWRTLAFGAKIGSGSLSMVCVRGDVSSCRLVHTCVVVAHAATFLCPSEDPPLPRPPPPPAGTKASSASAQSPSSAACSQTSRRRASRLSCSSRSFLSDFRHTET